MEIKLLTLLCASVLVFMSCGNNASSTESTDTALVGGGITDQSAIVNTGKSADEAYEMLHVVFEGNPEKVALKRLMSAVMAKYDIVENYENLNRCGSALLSMKKSSAIGVTEMQILKHMYQYGDATQSFPNQAAISAVLLEQNN